MEHPAEKLTEEEGANTGKVMNCQPSPDRTRMVIINGTGAWTEKNHPRENFFSFALQ